MDPVKAVASIAFTDISIKSDGTLDGTKITLNGKEIKGLASLQFSFYNSSYSPVSLGYRVEDGKCEAGTMCSSTYFSLIPPKPKAVATDGTIKAVADEVVSGFTVQSNENIPASMFRGGDAVKRYAQI